jgi:hypothetical protein
MFSVMNLSMKTIKDLVVSSTYWKIQGSVPHRDNKLLLLQEVPRPD